MRRAGGVGGGAAGPVGFGVRGCEMFVVDSVVRAWKAGRAEWRSEVSVYVDEKNRFVFRGRVQVVEMVFATAKMLEAFGGEALCKSEATEYGARTPKHRICRGES